MEFKTGKSEISWMKEIRWYLNPIPEIQLNKSAKEIKHKINWIITQFFRDDDYKTPKAVNDLFNLFENYTNQFK